MNTQISFVTKVLILSGAIALVIKYLAPQFEIPATDTTALVVVLLPTLIMALLLIWRGQKSSASKS